ncbi:MAG: S41 family peptidase [Saprospiraceae bacterium]
MKADFSTYRQLLETTHPGLYRYSDKVDMDARFEALDQELNQELSFYDFHKKIAGFSAQIRCGHTFVLPTKNVDDYIYQNIKTLPLYVYPIQGKLYVVFNGTTDESIKPGFELTQINGRSVDSISTVLKQHYWADGYIDLAKNKALDGGLFGMFYYILIEQPSEFQLTFKDLQGNKVEIKAPAQFLRETNKKFSKNPVNQKMLAYYNKNNKKPWRLSFPKELSETAILRFDGFGGKGMDDESSAIKAIRQFMDKSLAKIKKKKTRYLIIDVRDNGGGWDVQGAELLSYLVQADTTFPYYKRLHTITDESPFLKYADLSEIDLANVKKELKQESDGTFTMLPTGSPNILPQQPKPNRFKGQVYILMNANSNSTTSEFVAMAQQLKVGVFLGEEAGGAAQGGVGGSFIKYSLPNSGIYLQVPLVYYQNAVGTSLPNGRGAQPDHMVQLTIEDLLSNRKPVLDYTFNLIRAVQAIKIKY